MKAELAEKIRCYISKRRDTKLKTLHKERDKALKKEAPPESQFKTISEYSLAEKQLRVMFEPKNWMTDAARRASQITIATHALKFTHPSAKGSNILTFPSGNEGCYLSTDALMECCSDAVGNAAALDVAKLLQLEVEGNSLANSLASADYSILDLLADTQEQSKEWGNGLSKALFITRPSSHTLAKQVYFPVAMNEYHLLSPIYSSSLSQEIYDRIQSVRYADEYIEARRARMNNAKCSLRTTGFPNMAVIKHGGSKPQNVSQKNSERGGKTYLLPSTPPILKPQSHAPMDTTNIFSSYIVFKTTKHTVNELCVFLLSAVKKDNNENISKQRARKVDEIIDHILSCAIQIQQHPAGWSQESNLPSAQKLWLDPHNPDESHQQRYAMNEWQNSIAKDFSQWLAATLTRQTNEKNMLFVDLETAVWKKAFLNGLREIEEPKVG